MIRFVALAFAGVLIAWTSVCAASREVVLNTDDCISAINLARTALLNVSVPAVEAANTRASHLISIVKSTGNVYLKGDDTDCTLSRTSPMAVGGLFLKTDGVKQPDAKTIARLIQKELNDALNIIGNNYQEEIDRLNTDIYRHWAAQNLAFLMQSTAKEVTCASPSNCKTGQSVVICFFDTEPTPGKPPFSEALLSAMQARKAANVDIANLYEQRMRSMDGIKTSIPGAARAVPCTLAVFLSMFALLVAY